MVVSLVVLTLATALPAFGAPLTQQQVTLGVVQAFFVGLFYYFSVSPWFANLGFTVLYRPLIGGTLVGLVMGNPIEGMKIGATINVLYLGWISAGGTLPSDPSLAGYLGTALALGAGLDAQTALTLAVPLGILGGITWAIRMSVSPLFVHWADKYAEEGNIRMVGFCNVVPPQILLFIISFFPVFFGALYGVDAVKGVLNAIASINIFGANYSLLGALYIAGGMLGAVGIAMNLRFLFRGAVAAYFFLGFLLATVFQAMGSVKGLEGISQSSIVIIGVVGVALAFLHVTLARGGAPAPTLAKVPERKPSLLTRDDLFRSWATWLFFSHACYNWERLQASAFAHSMTPIIRRLYTTKEEISAALKRHLVFFNTQPDIGDVIHGIVAAMEEERAMGAPIDDDAINSVKTGLMGPLAGIGDTIQQGTVIPITLAIAITMAQQGNILGPILYIIITAAWVWGIGWFLYLQGYLQGRAAVTNILQGGLLSDVITGASVMGNLVMGALVVRFVSVKTPIEITAGGSTFKLQAVLDQFMPNLLPLLLVLLCWWLLNRRVNSLTIVIGIIVVALVGAFPWFGKFGFF